MRRKRLNEARSLLRGLAVPAPKKPCAAERSIHTGRADRHDVGIHHHVRHSPIALALVGDLDLESRVLLLQTSLLDIVSTLKGRSAVLEERLLPFVKQRRVKTLFVAQVRDRNSIHQMTPRNPDLILG